MPQKFLPIKGEVTVPPPSRPPPASPAQARRARAPREEGGEGECFITKAGEGVTYAGGGGGWGRVGEGEGSIWWRAHQLGQ